MPRHIKIGMIFLILLWIVGLSYYYNLQRRISEMIRPEAEKPRPYLASQPSFSEKAPLKKVKLYFPSASEEDRMVTEQREIHISKFASAEAKQIIAELIAGPKAGASEALPKSAQLRQLFITGNGLAVVDFTRKVSEDHVGGLTQEAASISAVVNSLMANVKTIQKVQIIIEGTEAETLAGHIDLSQPFDLAVLSELFTMTK